MKLPQRSNSERPIIPPEFEAAAKERMREAYARMENSMPQVVVRYKRPTTDDVRKIIE